MVPRAVGQYHHLTTNVDNFGPYTRRIVYSEMGRATQYKIRVDAFKYISDDMGTMIWHYSPAAAEALKEAGVVSRSSRRAFVVSILRTVNLQEGETEVNFMGLGLRILREGQGFLVQLLKE